jgi:hypothetical protein
MTPQVATVWASRTSDVNVPRSARVADRRKILPGFDVVNSTCPVRSVVSVVTCCASARAMSVARAGSPLSRNSLPRPPVATSTLPPGSNAMSYGVSSRVSHSASVEPSGVMRNTRPPSARRSCRRTRPPARPTR